MDHLRIPENQKPVHNLTGKTLRFLALLLCLCFVFLVSCVGRKASTQERESLASITAETLSSKTSDSVDDSQNSDAQTSTQNTTKTSDAKNAETSKTSSSSSKKADTSKTSKTSAPNSPSKKSSENASKTQPKSERPTSNAQKTPSKTTKTNERYCFLSIDCKTVLDNMQKLDPAKKDVVPEDGIILKKTKVSFSNGDSVYDVFKTVCQNNVCAHNCKYCKNRIQFESIVSDFGSVYIRGIHFLYEKDCGTHSGWMYKVNGVFPTKAVDEYKVEENDLIEFVYTCNLNDTGSSF